MPKKFGNRLANLRQEIVPKLMPLVLFGTLDSSILTNQSQAIINFSRNVKQQLANTEHSLKIRECAYLAPKQLNYDLSAIFYGNLDNKWYGKIDHVDVMYNPKIQDIDGKYVFDHEYFLNIPFMRATVGRYETVQVQYLDQDFEQKSRIFEGINARIIQQALDLLNGYTILDCRISHGEWEIIMDNMPKMKKVQINITKNNKIQFKAFEYYSQEIKKLKKDHPNLFEQRTLSELQTRARYMDKDFSFEHAMNQRLRRYAIKEFLQ